MRSNSGVAADPPRNKDDAIALRPRVAGSSFFWATQLMSYQRREAMCALCDLCHEVDDIDNGDASRQPRRARPAGFQNASISKCLAASVFHGKEASGPAFAKTEFATDSPPEGDGFELLVPRRRNSPRLEPKVRIQLSPAERCYGAGGETSYQGVKR